MVPAILFYDVVTAIHVMAVVVAFGVVFAYPVLFGWLRAQHPGALAAAHEAQGMIGKRIITPAATLALVAGIYLASDRSYWDQVWVGIPFVILIAILGVSGAFFAPQERKLAQLARDGGGARYDAAYKRLQTAQLVVGGLVLVAIFFMVTKAGAS